MANLKEIRTRITSVKTTRQVTSAMKVVSAAKLKKAQDAILQIRPYAMKLSGLLSTLSCILEDSDDSEYTVRRNPEKVLIVVISSNRGLCGGFNSYVTKKAMALAKTTYKEQWKAGKVSFLVIGKQAEKILRSYDFSPEASHNELFDHLTFESVSVIAQQLMVDFVSGKYDRIELVYNNFINAAFQEQVTEQFLPVLPVASKLKASNNVNYIFEPSLEYIVEKLIPRSLMIQFYKALLNSHAAEHGARMTAMHKATDNATELINELTLNFNKARQAAITNAILEVTNGAEALNG
ncbi:MAG TPA: ATP synthase F1 subunit gamma [Prolixibacteraceae bacterium]|jgi:F-type H+-transporting ATPase subunit gamma|nr:ATP synthase F1 subunit gamma [Prolixibacteraceae bacterium]